MTDPVSIPADVVKRLREETGAGMMECKRALVEGGGDLEKARQILREKGLAKSVERADRANEQGAIAAGATGEAAALVELRCETDFVAKSADFVNLANDIAAAVAQKGESATAELAGALDDLKLGLKENIELGRVVRFEAGPGDVLDTYLHIQSDRGVNGVLVQLRNGDRELAHDLCMHIAFSRPRYLTRDEVPAAEVEAERKVLEAQTRNEGKPEQAIPKIVEGKLAGRFFAERVLMEQKYVRDPKMTIKQFLGDAKVTRFAQLEVGRQKG